MRRILLLIIIFITVFYPTPFVSANEYLVRPFLIDRVGEPRDVFNETVVLTNNHSARKYVVYATVNEISVDVDGEIKEFVSPVMTDRTNTVTSWIEVTRGRIEILPGERKEVPLTLRINPFAEPGEYHAFVGFVPAPNRPEAENVALRGEADGVIVKMTVADNRNDSMKINSFLIDRFVTGDKNREISVTVENLGDIPSAPVGEVIFYDSRGVEVMSTPINSEQVVAAPGEKILLKTSIPLDDTLGRYKANVSLQYGENQRASLFDTTFFYMMPLHLLLLIFGVILIGVLFVTLLFRRTLIPDQYDNEDGDDVPLYVRNGHNPDPKDHDIDLKNTIK